MVAPPVLVLALALRCGRRCLALDLDALMIIRVVSLEPACIGHDDELCTGAVQEGSVMADGDHAAVEVQDVLLKAP